ncbi:MAG: hypothetical protein F6K36_17290 [Symploca sp. SIO3C6]|nr:hypothetical protein [Symploca sp. SIO3C6]NET03478.1 hypothetical protein [Symploca sp. SIO2B6]
MSNLEQDGKLWILNQFYGVTTTPPEEDYEAFIKAVLICAKADGVLEPEERNWVVGRTAVFGNSGYELAKTYPANEDLLEVLANAPVTNKHARRIILYVAIQACSADRAYHEDERTAVHKMAKYLGIEEDVVNQIEQLCIEEAKLREQRISVLFPEGIPSETELQLSTSR